MPATSDAGSPSHPAADEPPPTRRWRGLRRAAVAPAAGRRWLHQPRPSRVNGSTLGASRPATHPAQAARERCPRPASREFGEKCP